MLCKSIIMMWIWIFKMKFNLNKLIQGLTPSVAYMALHDLRSLFFIFAICGYLGTSGINLLAVRLLGKHSEALCVHTCSCCVSSIGLYRTHSACVPVQMYVWVIHRPRWALWWDMSGDSDAHPQAEGQQWWPEHQGHGVWPPDRNHFLQGQLSPAGWFTCIISPLHTRSLLAIAI